VIDAFVFIDLDGNDMITPSEFCIGMEKLMVPLKREEIQKACAMVAGVDKMIDCYEFFRTFAWDDILHLEEAFADAKIHKSSIVAMTKERLTIFFGRIRSDEGETQEQDVKKRAKRLGIKKNS
jgi:hypothetical protein